MVHVKCQLSRMPNVLNMLYQAVSFESVRLEVAFVIDIQYRLFKENGAKVRLIDLHTLSCKIIKTE